MGQQDNGTTGIGHSSGMPQFPEAFRRRLVSGLVGLNPSERSPRSTSAPVMCLAARVPLGSGGSLVCLKVFDVAFIVLQQIVFGLRQGLFKGHSGQPIFAQDASALVEHVSVRHSVGGIVSRA